VRVLASLVFLICVSATWASTPSDSLPAPLPVATLDLTSLLPPGPAELDWTTLSFVSETSIAVGLCSKGKPDHCSLSLVRWEGGELRTSARTLAYDSRALIHPAGDGRVLTTCYYSCKTALYSADLSTSIHLPARISLVSPSGSMAASKARGSWTAYRLSDRLELVREGDRTLYSVSDELVVFDDLGTIRTETLDGTSLGAFRAAKLCPNGVQILDRHRLFVASCKREPPIVDFAGKELMKLHLPTRNCDNEPAPSAGGSRLLFDCKSRKVSTVRNVGEIALEIALVGNADLQPLNNRQQVVVVDTLTGATCFDWGRSFPMSDDLHFAKAASLSPSGEFVAIAAEKTLSIYHLPAVCGTQP
jgi:hypothetical protein